MQHLPTENVMTLNRVAVLAVVAVCTISAALAQEQSASVTPSSDEAGLQKQCADKADHDKLGDDLRPTFMMECVASAKLDAPQKPTEQK